MAMTQVNVNLSWPQRRKLLKHPYVARKLVKVEICGDIDAWKWSRNVYLTGLGVDIDILLIYLGARESDYQLLRPRGHDNLLPLTAVALVVVMGGPASAGDYRGPTGSSLGIGGDAMSNDLPGGMPNFGGIPDLGIDPQGMSADAGWSLGEMVGGWINSWRNDPTLHDANTLGATGLAGGSCCGSDTLGTSDGMQHEPGPGGGGGKAW